MHLNLTRRLKSVVNILSLLLLIGFVGLMLAIGTICGAVIGHFFGPITGMISTFPIVFVLLFLCLKWFFRETPEENLPQAAFD
jgi:membrane protein implicated in regulation of membrane protease activity